jgi:hypothetical protein
MTIVPVNSAMKMTSMSSMAGGQSFQIKEGVKIMSTLSVALKERLIQLASNDALPLDLNELDASVFDDVIAKDWHRNLGLEVASECNLPEGSEIEGNCGTVYVTVNGKNIAVSSIECEE